jgi:hypothetical protein
MGTGKRLPALGVIIGIPAIATRLGFRLIAFQLSLFFFNRLSRPPPCDGGASNLINSPPVFPGGPSAFAGRKDGGRFGLRLVQAHDEVDEVIRGGEPVATHNNADAPSSGSPPDLEDQT